MDIQLASPRNRLPEESNRVDVRRLANLAVSTQIRRHQG